MAEASTVLSAQEKYNLIARNLEEVVGEDEIKKVLAERSLKGIHLSRKNTFFEKIKKRLEILHKKYVKFSNIKKNMPDSAIFENNVQFDNLKKKYARFDNL